MVYFLTVTVLATLSGAALAATPVCSLASANRLAALKTATQSYAATQGSPSYAYLAETLFTTFINHFYDTGNRRLRISYDSGTVSNYWNTAVAMQGMLDYASFHSAHGIGGMGWGSDTVVSTVQDIIATQKTLSGQCDSSLRNGYNDDMSWMMHALAKLYSHNGQSSYISMAEVLFDTVKNSDDSTCCGSHPGGIWWDTAHTSKATAAHMGATVAALKLMESGAATEYSSSQWLSWAQSHYSFWTSNFVNRGTGQVVDHEDTAGSLTWWGFTYNNGLALGAATHLYKATGQASYLTDAALFASYLLNGQTLSNGAKILNNDCGSCDGDCSQFHQVSMQYLMEYYNLLYSNLNKSDQGQVDALCNVYNFVKNNVDALWNYARNTGTGSVNCQWNQGWSSSQGGTDGLQGSMNSAMSAAAQFASLPIYVN